MVFVDPNSSTSVGMRQTPPYRRATPQSPQLFYRQPTAQFTNNAGSDPLREYLRQRLLALRSQRAGP